MKRYTTLLAVIVGGVAAMAPAVRPVTTEHTSEADFEPAESDRVAVWSLGEVTLGAAAEPVMTERDDVAAVTAVAVADDGTAYLGSATEGIVLRVREGAVTLLADLASAMVTDVVLAGDRLWVATAGDEAGVYAIDLKAAPAAEAVSKVWSDKQAASVWAIAAAGETIYAATAPNGKLYAIDAAGEAKVIFTAKQKVLRSVLATAETVYVGTSDKGLVYAVDVSAGEPSSRVLLDAEEKEIIALARDSCGNLYAAATNVTSAAPQPPAKLDVGKPARAPKPPVAEKPEPMPEPDGEPADADAEPEEKQPAAAPASPTTPPAGAAPEPKIPLIPPAAGEAPVPPMPAGGPQAPQSPPSTPRPSGRTPSASAKGNTIYRVDPGGLVKIVGKIPATILAMELTTRPTERLVIGAAGGQLRVIDVDNGAAGALAKLDPKKVPALAVTGDGAVYAGTAEPAILARISIEQVTRGTLVSKPIDAKQIARWGSVYVRADLPDKTAVTVATRTGNVAEPTDETWSDWSSPNARYAQYRLTLSRLADVAATISPVVDSVAVVHQVGNLPPEVSAIQVNATDRPKKRSGTPTGPLRYRAITIKATDPNSDELRYDLFYRSRGSEVWIRWAKQLSTPSAIWDTQTAPDGVYEIKVVATDAANNPPATALTDERVSRAVIADNTPPRIVELGVTVDGPDVRLTGSFADANRISRVQYRLDSDETPVAVAAADGMFDSPAEKIAVTLGKLKPGPHAVTVKVLDELGNAAYTTTTVTISE